MNDLDFIRDLRADVPEPSSAAIALGRARLTAGIASRTGRRTPRYHIIRASAAKAASTRRSMPSRALVALCAALAAGGVAAIVAVSATGGATRASHLPVRPAAVRPLQAVLAAKVLQAAAIAVAHSHAREPAAGQWFYSKTVAYEFGQTPATAVDNEWGTFDGRDTAYLQGSRLIVHENSGAVSGGGPTALGRFDFTATPRTAYRALASLPSNPTALLAVIAAHVATLNPNSVLSPIEQYAPTSTGQAAFNYLVELIWNASDGQPPAAQASVYRAMAQVPGVSVQQGITDAASQPAIGVSDDGGIDQLLLNPHTFAVIGIREVSIGVSPLYVASKAQMVRRILAGLKGRRLAAAKAMLRKYGNEMWQNAKRQDALPWPPKGAIVESLAIAALKPVRAPGLR